MRDRLCDAEDEFRLKFRGSRRAGQVPALEGPLTLRCAGRFRILTQQGVRVTLRAMRVQAFLVALGACASMDAHPKGEPDAHVPPPAVDLAAGSCGVLHELRVADGYDAAIRAPRSVIVWPQAGDAALFHWLALSEDGERVDDFQVASPRTPIALLPLGKQPGGVVLYFGDIVPLGAELMAEAIGGGSPHALGEIFRRGTMTHAHATSFDGSRAVFVSGHIATDPPDAFVIAPDGTLVGAPVPMLEGAADVLFDCLAVHPTVAAAAVSVTDKSSDPKRWRFYDLSASGAVQRELELDTSEAQGCPWVQPEIDGVTVALRWLGGVEVYRARAAGPLEHVATFRVEEEAELTLWVGELHGQLMSISRSPSGEHRFLRYDTAAARLFPVPGQLPHVYSIIPAEPGRVFATGRAGLFSEPRSVFELGCRL